MYKLNHVLLRIDASRVIFLWGKLYWLFYSNMPFPAMQASEAKIKQNYLAKWDSDRRRRGVAEDTY